MHYNLGLDISTSCTGYAISEVDSRGSTLKVVLGSIKLDHIDGLTSKANHVKSVLEDLKKSYTFCAVYVEENMQAFRPGASSAQTLVKLAKFNGIVCYIASQIFGVEPSGVNVNQARKTLGIQLQREKVCGVPTKEQIFKWASSQPLLTDFKWPTKKISSGPRKGSEVIETSSYDMADAFVVVLSGPILDVVNK